MTGAANGSQGRTGWDKPTADPRKEGLTSLPPLPIPHSCLPTQANGGPWGWSPTIRALHIRMQMPPLHNSSHSSPNTPLPGRKLEVNWTS